MKTLPTTNTYINFKDLMMIGLLEVVMLPILIYPQGNIHLR